MGKVSLLLDGFDEVCPYFKEFLIKAVQSYKVELGNQVWITTRIHLMRELEEELKQFACSLSPLTRDDQIKVVTEHWKLRNDDESINFNDLARNLIEQMSRNLQKSGSDLMRIPLQVRMIAEIYDGRIDEMQKLNFYSIYSKFNYK